jgi:amino acid adenylation domain-containing protein
VEGRTTKFDISVGIEERARGLTGIFEYNTDLFEESTIARIASHFHHLLSEVVAHPERRLSELSLMPPAQEQQLLIEWNRTAAPYPQGCIHELFERQVERTPDAVALLFADESLTYAELNRRANQLAHYLRRLSVGPDVLVAVMLERSLEMIVTLLGILKAGGAYVPLDPQYPQERLSYMLEDAQAQVLVTHSSLIGYVSEHNARTVCLDTEWAEIEGCGEENCDVVVSEQALAYVIYTSGSTGKPKGAMLPHGGVVNSLCWLQSTFNLSPSDRVMHKASLSFDVSVWEIFWPLATGAGVVVARPSAQHEGAYLAQAMTRYGVTAAHFVPSLLPAFLDAEGAGTSLRYVISGGEALPREMAQRFFAQSKAELHNVYGPTEVSIGSIGVRCEDERARASVPIGYPVSNIRGYILDRHMRPTPVGVAGELYLGGDGVARGYLGQAALTAERFVPDPFGTDAGERLYRTGDLVRYLSDGRMEYLGRIDQQVKIRGVRIELEEIEAVLAGHAAVREVVVMVREDEPGEKRLVAYVVGEEGVGKITTTELREHAKERLPEYMQPGIYVQMEEMPLTPSGKIDRRALPAPDGARPELEEQYEEPATETERKVAGIWQEVLKVERVGRRDNFFELGGHSLLATQVISRVRELFYVDISLRRLFEQPTVWNLAKEIDEALETGEGLIAPPIVRVSRDGDLPLSFAQQRLWFLAQLEPDGTAYNMPVAARMSGPLNVTSLEQTITEIVRRHEVLRTTFTTIDGQPVQVISSAYPINIPVTDLSRLPLDEQEKEVRRLAGEEGGRPFDLERGPLLRVGLLRLAEEEHMLLFTMHHVVSDAWSMRVLMDEMTVLYQAYATGKPSPLPELEIQYADFAYWQRHWLQGEILDAHLSYWKRQLNYGEDAVLNLPTDRPRPPMQTFGGAAEIFSFPLSLTEKIRALTNTEGATLYMTMLAVFQLLLWRYTGQDGINIGVPSAGRNRNETEPLIGFFINTLVLRTEFAGNPSFRELLRRAKETALGAYAHEDVPFEKLVEVLHPARDLSRTPLFQAMFVLTTPEQREPVELPGGLKLTPVLDEGVSAKYDLILSLVDRKQGLGGAIAYNVDLFDQTTIARMVQHLERLLESIVVDPDQQAAQLKLLSSGEEQQLLVEWNRTEALYSHERCLHELFEAQVERSPSAVALQFESQELTYAELNERANRLAHYLRELGVGPESLVGICMERAPEMIVALFAVLKAGGAYVPLDPAYPRDRLAFMLEDAGIELLLSQKRLAGMLPPGIAKVLHLDAEWDSIAARSGENLPQLATPQNLAYMIYTSGSTGEPKGVMTAHAALVNYTESAIAGFELSPGDRVLQFASISFDAAAEEIYPCLTRGATLVLRTDLMISSIPVFLEACRDFAITVLDLPTAYWHYLTAGIAAGNATLPDSLRLVIIGGERALPGSLAAWHRVVDGKVRLVNTYGPTETTIVATKDDLTDTSSAQAMREVPIGRPVTNTRAYVLDRNLQPAAIGVSGELYIGGAGQARGYFNRPVSTAEKFIPDPFGAQPGGRLYKTGDLARYLPDGRLEFAGRIDHQVKVRGFRIEPGEIETVLGTHASVREVIVVARDDGQGDKRLVAYIVAAPGEELAVADLRRVVQEKLPEYMMPSAFVMLDKLPLTPSGKVNQRALPVPDNSRPLTNGALVLPRTQTEAELVKLFAEVLKVEQVGVTDSFFELGGHSLLATQLIMRVRTTFQIDLPLRRLFELPVLAQLAVEIDKAQQSGVGLTIPKITTRSRDAHRMKRSSLNNPPA